MATAREKGAAMPRKNDLILLCCNQYVSPSFLLSPAQMSDFSDGFEGRIERI